MGEMLLSIIAVTDFHRYYRSQRPFQAGEDAANSRYAAATDSTGFPLLARFRAFSKARPIS
jgi:hypothetical protein